MGKPSELVDIDLSLRMEKELSVAFTDGSEEPGPRGKRERWFWFPKSQVEWVQKARDIYTVTMPRWLAEEKGLV